MKNLNTDAIPTDTTYSIEKVIKVVESCNNRKQLVVALKYVKLAEKRQMISSAVGRVERKIIEFKEVALPRN